MDREVLFAQTLEKVKGIAKEQGGCIDEAQVKEEFAALSLSDEQLQMVFDYLIKHKIGIGEPVNPDDFLTEGEKNYLQNYLNALADLPSYSQGEKETFTVAAMAGESDAKRRLTEIYLRDVVDIAKLYAGQGVFMEDLIGEGNVALTSGMDMLGSLEKPSEAQGMLARRLMDAMEDYIRENASNRRTDKKVADRVNLVAQKAEELARELGRKVTAEELARESGLSVKAIEEAGRMSGYKIEDIEYAKDGL